MNAAMELQRLYDSGISFSITTAENGGFDVKLGDGIHGYDAEENTMTVEEAIHWLQKQVTQQYPESDYARAPVMQ